MPLFSSSKKEKDAPSTPKSAKATPMVDEPESTKASRVLDSVMDDDDVPMTEESMAAEAKEAYIEQATIRRALKEQRLPSLCTISRHGLNDEDLRCIVDAVMCGQGMPLVASIGRAVVERGRVEAGVCEV